MSDFDREADRVFLDTSSSGAASPAAGPDDVGAGRTGSGEWSPLRARMLGALIEKALATPQNYPLSINALTMACNQTTNRDPIMDLTESQVEQLLAEAKTDGWLRFVHPRSGRGVTKYRHIVDEVLGLDDKEVALIGVLALRGPQTASELRSRTERLAPMEAETVDQVLTDLARRQPQPLVRRLEREPGHREPRWIQLLCPAQGEDRVGQPAVASPRRAVATTAAAEQANHAELRQELDAVRAELAELRAEFEAFRAEFG